MNRTLAARRCATALLLVAAGCGTSADRRPVEASPAAAETQTLTVFAAASLKIDLHQLGQQFETTHPGTKVTFSFAGSSDLVTQLQQGAPATCSPPPTPRTWTRRPATTWSKGTPVNFASNTLEIAVPPDNPAKIASFADLAEPGVKVVVCAPQVPCGSATQKVETATGVDAEAGQRGELGHRRAEQGHHRGGRRRAGLRHRRQGCRRQGAGRHRSRSPARR